MKEQIVQIVEKAFAGYDENSPGIALNLILDGQVIYEKYAGLANVEYQIPVTRETVFPISSITKQFTAMLVMQMIEEGRLSLTDPLVNFFPELNSYAGEIQIQQMLHHVTGLLDPYNYYQETGANSYGVSNQGIYQLLCKEEALQFQPGEQFEYCNSNYMLLAQISEQIYGKSYRELLQEKIFAPSGMITADLYDQRYVIPNRAYGYKRQEDGQLRTVDCQWLSYGDGGILATIQDLYHWDQTLDTAELVSQEMLNQSFESGKTNAGQPTNYGYGWVIEELNDITALRHAGGDDGFGSMICRIPEKNVSFLCLANLDHSWKEMSNVVNNLVDFTCEVAKESE